MNKFELCENLMTLIAIEFETLEERHYTEEERNLISLLIIRNINEAIKKSLQHNRRK